MSIITAVPIAVTVVAAGQIPGLAEFVGLTDETVGEATGTLATLTLALAVVATSSSSRLASLFASWNGSEGYRSDSTASLHAEYQRVTALLILLFALYLVTIVTALLAMTLGAWLNTVFLAIAASYLLVEILRTLQDVWKDPGVKTKRAIIELRTRRSRLLSIGSDEPTAFVVWFICMSASLIVTSTSLFSISAGRSMHAFLFMLFGSTLVCVMSYGLIASLASLTGGARRVLGALGFAYFGLPLFGLVAVGIVAVMTGSTSGVSAAIGILTLAVFLTLGWAGIHGRGPLNSFAHRSITAVEREITALRNARDHMLHTHAPENDLTHTDRRHSETNSTSIGDPSPVR